MSFNAEKKQVLITGRLFVGSRTCKVATVESAKYKESENRLSIVITDDKSDAHPDNQLFGSGGCDDARSSNAYKAKITFCEELPEHVTALERDALGNTTSSGATSNVQRITSGIMGCDSLSLSYSRGRYVIRLFHVVSQIEACMNSNAVVLTAP
ncbi:hypothetical protein GCM10025751_46520 [Haladaptatus pallidirubidus]|uniref:Uncharacterized protein n=1 Tax=Haladaptatus pallidirubidus TaxID=1008152 RepID=A0AAV3UNZ8_9EURY